jgi:hypothetical protein
MTQRSAMGSGAEEAKERPPERIPLRMVLDPSEKVIAEQLSSLDFWEERLVATAVRYERLSEQIDARPEEQRISLSSSINGLESLERCRTPGLEKRIAALQQDASARVATGAGMLLTRWKRDVDRARYTALLKSPDAKVSYRAAAILTLSGADEGIDYLIEQASREGPAGKAYATLGRYADEPRLTADQRMHGAVRIIETLLPSREAPSAISPALLARRWTGQDYGYRAGAAAEENNKALHRYPEWSRHPLPSSRPADAGEAPAGAP